MSDHAKRLWQPFVLVTAGFLVAVGLQPVAASRIVAAYVLALAALALELLTRVVASRSAHGAESPFEQALARRAEAPTRPAELQRVERELTLGMSSSGHLHARLLPMLREIAIARLGYDALRSSARARAALGEETWELLRPDRPAPEDRHAPGIRREPLVRCIESLERL
ncbi:MAG TPA: hypothetical protein VFA30_06035 [Gaiellaceae bacterium]|nr:hypothetical protein [Gaiellaceae bacterium]